MAKKNNGDSEHGSINKSDKKQKLFIPRRQSGEDSKWNQWNKEQPTKIIDDKEVRINQWDWNGWKQGYWEAFNKGPFIVEEGYYINNVKRFELSDLNTISALNKVNDRLKKIEDRISSNHWELQNCIRFYLEGVQIGFRMWQMNIPRVGETVGIKFLEGDESLEYVSQFFQKDQNSTNNNDVFPPEIPILGYFFFIVENVTYMFTEGVEIENDSGCEYHLQLIPKLS